MINMNKLCLSFVALATYVSVSAQVPNFAGTIGTDFILNVKKVGLKQWI